MGELDNLILKGDLCLWIARVDVHVIKSAHFSPVVLLTPRYTRPICNRLMVF
jgi:hypothetical protein